MKCLVNGTILGAALVLGLGAHVASVTASSQDQNGARVRSEDHLSTARHASFEVPALWEYTAPLIAPETRNSNPSRAQKDPTVVFHEGQWHVFMTVIEENGRRYYKAYLADQLDGKWTPVADTAERPFAGCKNIRPAPGVQAWTDNVSHGELIRDGCDQTLTIDPGDLRFIFQGMWDEHKSGKGYGQFQWRIGMLTPVPVVADLN